MEQTHTKPALSRDALQRVENTLKKSENFQKLMIYYRCAMMEVETKFKVIDEQFSIKNDRNPIERIESRLKDPYSIVEKMYRRNIPVSVENIEPNLTDIAGIRVICAFEDDIFMLADCILAQDDVSLVEIKDYINNPKENGYRSLHLIVEIPIYLTNEKKSMKVEVQLRTIAMDFWASVEHRLKYKKGHENDEQLTKDLELCAYQISLVDQKMLEVRKRIDEYPAFDE